MRDIYDWDSGEYLGTATRLVTAVSIVKTHLTLPFRSNQGSEAHL